MDQVGRNGRPRRRTFSVVSDESESRAATDWRARAHFLLVHRGHLGEPRPRRCICLIATATAPQLLSIGSLHAPMSYLCTGRNGSGQVALPLMPFPVVSGARPQAARAWEWSSLSAATAAHCRQQSRPRRTGLGSTQFPARPQPREYEDVHARLSNEPLLSVAGDRAGPDRQPSAGMGHAAGAGTPPSRCDVACGAARPSWAGAVRLGGRSRRRHYVHGRPHEAGGRDVAVTCEPGRNFANGGDPAQRAAAAWKSRRMSSLLGITTALSRPFSHPAGSRK
jgi:hypothetical protein